MPVFDPILATIVLLLVQMPPPGEVSGAVNPTQAIRLPVIGEGDDITVTVIVAAHPVDNV
jgi:hypothetical protein